MEMPCGKQDEGCLANWSISSEILEPFNYSLYI